MKGEINCNSDYFYYCSVPCLAVTLADRIPEAILNVKTTSIWSENYKSMQIS